MGFIERANLKDVGVVPAFPKRGVRENETQRLGRIEQALLVAHDKTVGVIIISGIAPRVLGSTLLVLREISVVNLLRFERRQPFVDRPSGQFAIRFLKPLADLAKAGRAVIVIDAIVCHAVDEKER